MKKYLKKYFYRNYYEDNSTAKFLARVVAPFFFPVFLYFKFRKYLFLTNGFPGVGHILPETDNYLRKKYLGEIPKNSKYIFLHQDHPIPKEFAKVYGHLFHKCITSYVSYALLTPLLMRYSSLTVDIGVAAIKNHKFHDLSFKDSLNQQRAYYTRKSKSLNFFPLRLEKPKPTFLNIQSNKKLCILHIRTHLENASAQPTDPLTLLPTIDFLVENGYQVVLSGRDEIPKILIEKGCINYAQSEFTSFENDLALFNAADLAIVSSAGTFLFADCLNIPLLYINTWHLNLTPFNKKCVYLPTLVKDSTRYLTLEEQNDILEKETYTFPDTQYQARNATEDEILHALHELLELIKNDCKRTSLQEQIRFRFPNKGWASVSESRMSHYFLEKNKALISGLY